VVTGIGVISPIGLTVEEFWHNLTHGVSGVGTVTAFDASPYACRIAGEVKDFDPTQYMDAKAARRASRFVQFAVAATKMALADAGLAIDDHNRDSVGVVMNTGGGGMPEPFADTCPDPQHGLLSGIDAMGHPRAGHYLHRGLRQWHLCLGGG
jgi:3-oxoacyl-[acyl-carrier-protein] synthase II